MILNNGYRDNVLEYIGKPGELVIEGYPTVSINTDAFLSDDMKGNQKARDKVNNALESENIDDIKDNKTITQTINGSRAVSRLVKPTNFMPPETNPNNIEDVKTKDLGFDGDIGITEENKKLMNELQTKKARMNPIINNLFMSMHEEMLALDEIDPINPESTLKNIYKNIGINNEIIQNRIFGTFIGSTNDDFKSKIGQSISKENPLMQMLMWYPNMVDKDGNSIPYYHQMGLYRTTRMEYMSTFLNEQMDKNIARYMTVGEPVSFDVGSAAYISMLKSIMDRTKLNRCQPRY
jgi:hypothetical protein